MVALRRPQIFAPRAFFKKRQGWLALIAAAALISAIGALQVNQLSTATVTSYEINELNRERAAKQAANHELEAEVAGLSSLARVDIEARQDQWRQPGPDGLALRRAQVAKAADRPDTAACAAPAHEGRSHVPFGRIVIEHRLGARRDVADRDHLPIADIAEATGTTVIAAPMAGGPFVASSGEINLTEAEPRAKDESWSDRRARPDQSSLRQVQE